MDSSPIFCQHLYSMWKQIKQLQFLHDKKKIKEYYYCFLTPETFLILDHVSRA